MTTSKNVVAKDNSANFTNPPSYSQILTVLYEESLENKLSYSKVMQYNYSNEPLPIWLIVISQDKQYGARIPISKNPETFRYLYYGYNDDRNGYKGVDISRAELYFSPNGVMTANAGEMYSGKDRWSMADLEPIYWIGSPDKVMEDIFLNSSSGSAGYQDSGNPESVFKAGFSDIINPVPTITLAISPASVKEDGNTNLVYAFTRTGATTNALTVNFSIDGTAIAADYTGATPGTGKTITFLAGASTATLTIDPTSDTTVESDETVAITLASGTGYTVGTTDAVVGTITNDDLIAAVPTITLAISPASVKEDGNTNLVYAFTRTGATTNALTVNFSIDGTAIAADYTGATPGTGKTITFLAGASTATLTIDPTSDTTVESDETVAITLASGTGYTVGTTDAVVGTITNDDLIAAVPTITLAISPASVKEDGNTNLVYTFTRTGSTQKPLIVNYTVGGTAILGTDYTGISKASATKTVTFAAKSSTALVKVDPTADSTQESDETVAITLASGTGYTVGTTDAVTGTITNDDNLSGKFLTTWNYAGHTYGLVGDLKSWQKAKIHAESLGGYLAEISDAAENNQIFDRIKEYILANPDKTENSYAMDGGGSVYAWLGASDAKKEGSWIWNSGGKVLSTRIEWGSGKLGKEPDNYNKKQHYLALGLENWPYGTTNGQGFGNAGQWNDLIGDNKLLSVVEFNSISV